uniref:DNA-directed RNA polymerase III subunit RPC4 n=1 Tax=Rhodosorus marinus TaxID=101924 RepID=A0A7S3EBH7_9RHOD|mmetsp:Transcript_201/g.463  ORF Transcript_201/g.463 Transcript_201/m.463 type:complete len:294 (+) Transcript_201:92-973(+)|eukprot:CAMPEP_0113960274 /NCGR_PEP_ID=MMETSP0011_2-20120614/4621_1 /TAXON_ID=101924 /ORGANISM="Rhodosorus marinus" /LENGTH=293 /DNA_ID=CAMNT_0000971703 /DNA_START=78 /DNA_END=959 /DNA_ORIENTATION=- /assembly_acc=CAM_ASM_000156
MPEDRPKFKPNASAAGSRRGRRTRIPQLVPQAGGKPIEGKPGESATRGQGSHRGFGSSRPSTRRSSFGAEHEKNLEKTRTQASQGGKHEDVFKEGNAFKAEPRLEKKTPWASGNEFESDDEMDNTSIVQADEKIGKGDPSLFPVPLPHPHGLNGVLEKEEPAHGPVASKLLDENQVSIVQLPSILPIQLPTQSEEPQDHLDGEEQAKNLLSDLRTVTGEPMLIGKLRLYKSGKVKLVFGDDVEMNVTPGAECSFAEHLIQLRESQGKLVHLADLENRFVAVPDLDLLLADRSK